MADFSQGSTQGLPDIQSLLGSVVSQIQPSMQETSNQMGALQDYIRGQQKDQMNIPALQFAAGLLKPTRTGSFGESVGEAGSGALESLQKQRSIDLDRQSKILELQQAKGSLLAQQAQMLLPFAKMQQTQSILGGDTGNPPAMGGAPTAAPANSAGSAKFASYQNKINALAVWNPEAAAILQKQMEQDPDVASYRAGQVKGAEKGAEAPYDFVDIKMPDGSMAKVPMSAIVHPGGAARQVAAAPGAAPGVAPPAISPPVVAAGGTGLPPGAISTAPNMAQETGIKMAATEAEKVPEALESLEQQDQRMQSIGDVMQKYQTGAFSEPKADALAALRAAGFNVKDTDTANPAALQEFRKNSVGQIFDKVKEFGGQVKVAEITGLGKVVTDPDLQPEANQAIAAQIRGVIDWRKQMLGDYAKDYHGNKVSDPATWKDDWIKAHPLGQFVGNRLAQTPVMGVTPENVPNGALGVADKDYADSKGNITVRKGDKFMRMDNHAVPLSRLDEYYAMKGGN